MLKHELSRCVHSCREPTFSFFRRRPLQTRTPPPARMHSYCPNLLFPHFLHPWPLHHCLPLLLCHLLAFPFLVCPMCLYFIPLSLLLSLFSSPPHPSLSSDKPTRPSMHHSLNSSPSISRWFQGFPLLIYWWIPQTVDKAVAWPSLRSFPWPRVIQVSQRSTEILWTSPSIRLCESCQKRSVSLGAFKN